MRAQRGASGGDRRQLDAPAAPRHGRALDRAVDVARDHVLGRADAEVTLLEYGSYACPHCHAAHPVIANLRDRFGDRMRYVFRHLPIRGSADAVPAAELAEYAGETTGKFWAAHDVLMQRGPVFEPGGLGEIARSSGCLLATRRTRRRPEPPLRGSRRMPRARDAAARW